LEKKKIDRINELAHKSKSVGLTPEEKKEQEKLRNEYRAGVVRNLSGQLDNCYIIDEHGNKQSVKARKKK